MKKRSWILAGCMVMLAAPAADARMKSPEPGSVTCECQCVFKTSDGSYENEPKFIGGYGKWKGTRTQCKEFDGSECQGSVGDESGVGKIVNCDTIVHQLPPGAQDLESAPPASGEKAPLPGQPGGGANLPGKLPGLPPKPQRKTD